MTDLIQENSCEETSLCQQLENPTDTRQHTGGANVIGRCPTTCLCELRTILKVYFLSMPVQRALVSRCTTQGWDYPVTIISWCNYYIVFKISLQYCYFQNFKDKTEELFLKYWPILDLNWTPPRGEGGAPRPVPRCGEGGSSLPRPVP